MSERTVTVMVAALGIGIVGASALGQPPAPPPPRPIPGVTAPDQFPRGCVDCHVNRPDLQMDVRLSTLMAHWQQQVDPAFLAKVAAFAPEGLRLTGKHPNIGDALSDIPRACLDCHAESSTTAPPFARLLHGLHLVGGDKNHFVTMFQGECTHCHKLDTSTGEWLLASAAE